MSNTVFVTGSEGFIGSHVVEALLKKKYKVIALVKYNSFSDIGHLKYIKKNKNLNIVFGDITDIVFLEKHCRNVNFIIHLAAIISIPFSYVSSRFYIDTNIIGTYNILEISKKYKIKKIVHTSTSEIYGTADYVPMDEKHPIKPQSPYAATKISADLLCISYFKSFNLPVTIIRPFNCYGPRQSPRAFIPAVMVQLLKGVKKLKLGSLHPTRDFTYVTDTADGFIKALKLKKHGDIINLGSNFEISMRETVEKIIKISGLKNIKISQETKRLRPKKSEVERLFSKSSKAKRILKWSPTHNGKKGFEEGLVKTFKWFKQNNHFMNIDEKKYYI